MTNKRNNKITATEEGRKRAYEEFVKQLKEQSEFYTTYFDNFEVNPSDREFMYGYCNAMAQLTERVAKLLDTIR